MRYDRLTILLARVIADQDDYGYCVLLDYLTAIDWTTSIILFALVQLFRREQRRSIAMSTDGRLSNQLHRLLGSNQRGAESIR